MRFNQLFSFFISRICFTILLIWSIPSFAQLTDPIPQTIEFGDLELVLEEWLTIPSSSTVKPYARINMIREIPRMDGTMAVNDLNGPMYFVTKTGEIHEFMDLNDKFENFIPSPGKGTGFGAFAFHPDYRENGYFFTAHAETYGIKEADFKAKVDNGIALQWVLTRWKDNDPLDLTFTGSREEMMRLDFPTIIHGLQDLMFDPFIEYEEDGYGYLYVCVGEGGSGKDALFENVQNKASHLGTIFRIDPLGSNGKTGKYGIPSDNPFVDEESALGEIWAYGFRNPHRIHFEQKGDEVLLFTGDIGEKNIEELNIVEKGGNYGWSKREGAFMFDIEVTRDHVFELPSDDDSYDFIYPVAQYDHDEGLAIVSGHVWHSDRISELDGTFFMGDIPSGRVFYAPVDELVQGSQYDLKAVRLYNTEKEEKTLADLVGIERVDLRFGYDFAGEVFIIAKANAVIYKVHLLYDWEVEETEEEKEEEKEEDVLVIDTEVQKPSVYPNPSQNGFYLGFDNGEVEVLAIYDLIGKSMPVKVTKKGASWYINAQDWFPGAYFATLRVDGKLQTIKLVKI